MINFFPLQENVEIEEIYGIKRENATPKGNGKTFIFGQSGCKSEYIYHEPLMYQWFQDDEISNYEINNFGKLDRKEYLTIRNFIIDKYKAQLNFISLTSVVQENIGPFEIVYKVFSFLEKLKIINNRDILNESKVVLNKLVGKDFSIKEKTFLDNHDLKDDNQVNRPQHNNPNSNFYPKNDIYSSEYLNFDKFEEGFGTKVCNEQKSESLKKKVSTKIFKYEDVVSKNCKCGVKAQYFSHDGTFLCLLCRNKGSYSLEKSNSDFHKIESQVFERIWNKKEEIQLLEAVDKYGDDWISVSKYIGTKSKHECIYHFINIPIQENNLSKQDYSIILPFLSTSNPIMYYVTFLSSVVHPSVGAEAARIAIKEVANGSASIFKLILLETKKKAKELCEIENKKINRCNEVIEEGLINLIDLKIKTFKDLNACVEKVRNELVVLRNKIIEGSDDES